MPCRYSVSQLTTFQFHSSLRQRHQGWITSPGYRMCSRGCPCRVSRPPAPSYVGLPPVQQPLTRPRPSSRRNPRPLRLSYLKSVHGHDRATPSGRCRRPPPSPRNLKRAPNPCLRRHLLQSQGHPSRGAWGRSGSLHAARRRCPRPSSI